MQVIKIRVLKSEKLSKCIKNKRTIQSTRIRRHPLAHILVSTLSLMIIIIMMIMMIYTYLVMKVLWWTHVRLYMHVFINVRVGRNLCKWIWIYLVGPCAICRTRLHFKCNIDAVSPVRETFTLPDSLWTLADINWEALREKSRSNRIDRRDAKRTLYQRNPTIKRSWIEETAT